MTSTLQLQSWQALQEISSCVKVTEQHLIARLSVSTKLNSIFWHSQSGSFDQNTNANRPKTPLVKLNVMLSRHHRPVSLSCMLFCSPAASNLLAKQAYREREAFLRIKGKTELPQRLDNLD